jgi:FAD synthase
LEGCNCDLDERIRVEWVAFIRDEKQFDSVDALKEQIAQDCQSVKSLLSNG